MLNVAFFPPVAITQLMQSTWYFNFFDVIRFIAIHKVLWNVQRQGELSLEQNMFNSPCNLKNGETKDRKEILTAQNFTSLFCSIGCQVDKHRHNQNSNILFEISLFVV